MIFTLLKKFFGIKAIYPENTFKIVAINGQPDCKNLEVVYQVSGKSTINMDKPEVLVNELMHIKGFSKNESGLIHDLFCMEKSMPDFRIMSMQFEIDPIKFEIEDIGSSHTLLLTAKEIIASNKIMEKFSPNDLTMIYYQLFKEDEIAQKMMKAEIKKLQTEKQEGNLYVLKNSG